jgi:voltage-gated potassium channel
MGLPAGKRMGTWYERLTLFRAIRTILAIATALVLIAGVLARAIEPETYTSIGLALWWAVTTVTTVGYGDVVPVTTAGRLVGAALMLTGLSLIPLLVSVVVSILTAKRSREQHERDARNLEELSQRLERIDERLSELQRP